MGFSEDLHDIFAFTVIVKYNFVLMNNGKAVALHLFALGVVQWIHVHDRNLIRKSARQVWIVSHCKIFWLYNGATTEERTHL